MDSIFAGKADIGGRYVTKMGYPVVVLERDERRAILRNELTGEKVRVFLDQLLWPYSPKHISKEAIQMAKTTKAAPKKGTRDSGGNDRGVLKTGQGLVVFRKLKDVTHEGLVQEGHILYRTKSYDSLKAAAEAMRGKAVSGSGKSFFGLRRPEHKAALKEIEALLKKGRESTAKAKKTAKKASKGKDEEEDETLLQSNARTVGEVVAKVFGKGR